MVRISHFSEDFDSSSSCKVRTASTANNGAFKSEVEIIAVFAKSFASKKTKCPAEREVKPHQSGHKGYKHLKRQAKHQHPSVGVSSLMLFCLNVRKAFKKHPLESKQNRPKPQVACDSPFLTAG